MKRRIILELIFLVFLASCFYPSQVQNISMPQKGVYHQVSWSPDGKQAITIFRSQKDFEMRFYLYDLSSQEWVMIEEIEDFSYDVDWINQEIIVFEKSEINKTDSSLLKSTLVFYNLKTKVQNQLDWGTSINSIKKRPFHNELAVQREIEFNYSGIYLHDIRTNQEIQLYKPLLKQETVHEIAWSPDGKAIAFILTKDNPLRTTPLHFYSLNILEIESRNVKTLIEYSNLTLDHISWSRTHDIVVREIGADYERGIQVFSITPEGNKTYLNLNGFIPIQVVFSPLENIAFLTSLGTPGSNDIFLFLHPNGE